MNRAPIAYEGKGNPDPYPFNGDHEALVAWLKKEEELTGVPQHIPARPPRTATKSDPASRPAVFPSGALVDPSLAKDWRELPTDSSSLRRTLAPMGHEAREVWLTKLVVASARLGGLSGDVIIAALQDVHQMQLDSLMQCNSELERENRELKAKLNHLERQGIDLAADQIIEDARVFIREEIVRQVEDLERRITKAAGGAHPEVSEVEKLHATTVLLRDRIGTLEMLNPIWISKFSTGQ